MSTEHGAQQYMEDILAVTLFLGGGTLVLLSISPIGRAIAERIKGRPQAAVDAGAHEEVLAALEQVRREVADLAERVDFTERLLAKPGDTSRKHV